MCVKTADGSLCTAGGELPIHLQPGCISTLISEISLLIAGNLLGEAECTAFVPGLVCVPCLAGSIRICQVWHIQNASCGSGYCCERKREDSIPFPKMSGCKGGGRRRARAEGALLGLYLQDWGHSGSDTHPTEVLTPCSSTLSHILLPCSSSPFPGVRQGHDPVVIVGS